MNVELKDLIVEAAMVLSAVGLYALGYRARSVLIGLGLVALPIVVWVACKTWLYPTLDGAGISRFVGAMPAIATFVAVVVIVLRGGGGLTYRVPLDAASFGRSLRAADLAMRRAYEEVPEQSSTGQILIAPLRNRLERAMVAFTSLEPPPGAWTRLLAEGIDLHRAYIDVLTSPVPRNSDALAPVWQRTRDWIRDVEDLIASDERAQS